MCSQYRYLLISSGHKNKRRGISLHCITFTKKYSISLFYSIWANLKLLTWFLDSNKHYTKTEVFWNFGSHLLKKYVMENFIFFVEWRGLKQIQTIGNADNFPNLWDFVQLSNSYFSHRIWYTMPPTGTLMMNSNFSKNIYIHFIRCSLGLVSIKLRACSLLKH